jgi:hypothetical protein
MDRNSQRVVELTLKAGDFLKKRDTTSAEAGYKHALAEGVRLLGLRHSLTRNVLSVYSTYLRASKRDGEAIRFEALYWKTAPPECYRLGLLFGEVKTDVKDFLEKNAAWVENWGRQMSLDSRQRGWRRSWGKSVIATVKEYFQDLRQHVAEFSE